MIKRELADDVWSELREQKLCGQGQGCDQTPSAERRSASSAVLPKMEAQGAGGTGADAGLGVRREGSQKHDMRGGKNEPTLKTEE